MYTNKKWVVKGELTAEGKSPVAKALEVAQGLAGRRSGGVDSCKVEGGKLGIARNGADHGSTETSAPHDPLAGGESALTAKARSKKA